MDVNTSSFEREVVEASRSQPVVVDFWAPWCAPCRALGPVLERLEVAYAGRFKLVKVNSDENRELSAAFGVRSIPFVVGFRDGKPAAQFLGAQPEGEVRAFLERLLPPPELAQAAQAIDAGRLDEAEPLLDAVRPNIDWDERVATLRQRIAFARSGGNEGELAARVAAKPADCEARLTLAGVHASGERYREALEQLLEIVRRDRDWHDGEARRQMLAIFNLAANDPDLVSEYRSKLARALY